LAIHITTFIIVNYKLGFVNTAINATRISHIYLCIAVLIQSARADFCCSWAYCCIIIIDKAVRRHSTALLSAIWQHMTGYCGIEEGRIRDLVQAIQGAQEQQSHKGFFSRMFGRQDEH
jgi:hypothetical protein